MKYSFEKIDTVQACDVLLTGAQEKKQTLERKRRNLGEAIDTFRKRIDAVAEESVTVQLLLDAYTAAYHALSEGSKDKASIHVQVKRLELRQARVVRKSFTYNVRSLIVKEIKYNTLDSQVSAIESYIAAVEQLRTVLDHAALRASQATALRPPVAGQNMQFENGSPQIYFLPALLYTKNSNLKRAGVVFGRLMRSQKPDPLLITG